MGNRASLEIALKTEPLYNTQYPTPMPSNVTTHSGPDSLNSQKKKRFQIGSSAVPVGVPFKEGFRKGSTWNQKGSTSYPKGFFKGFSTGIADV